jgi:hypothetical protein
MSDPLVARWKQRGNISLWRVKERPGKGWNFSGDAEGCSALAELLALMETAEFGSRKTLALVKADTTPDHGGAYTNRFAKALTVSYPKDRVPADHWVLTHAEGEVKIELGSEWLTQLREGIAHLPLTHGDFAIGGDDARLWLWE